MYYVISFSLESRCGKRVTCAGVRLFIELVDSFVIMGWRVEKIVMRGPLALD